MCCHSNLPALYFWHSLAPNGGKTTTMHTEWQGVIIKYSIHFTYQPPAECSRGEFMRPFASVSVLSMADSFNCLLQATDSINNFFLLLLLLHNHLYRVNPCGSCDSLLLQMIKPCQNSTKETMNTKQGPADFIFYFFAQIIKCENCWGGKTATFFFPLLCAAISTESVSLRAPLWIDSQSEEWDRWRRRDGVKSGDRNGKRWPLTALRHHTSQSFIKNKISGN